MMRGVWSTFMSCFISRQRPQIFRVNHNRVSEAATYKQHSPFRHQRTTQAAVSSTKEACEEANARAKEKSDEKWRRVLREHLAKAAEEAAAVAAAVSKEHDAVLEETQQAFRM